MSDSGERTEQASQKRMKEVREKGKLQRSTDLTAWVGIGAAIAVLPGVISGGTAAATAQLLNAVAAVKNPDPAAAVDALGAGLGTIIPTLAVMFAVVCIAVIVTSVAQGGLHFKKFEVKFDHFNPVSGMKRMFGMQALWQGVKSLLKTGVVALVLYLVIQSLMPVLMQSGGLNITALIGAAGDGVTGLAVSAVAAGLIVSAFDVFVIWKKNRKQTMMTKKEVTDEHKNTEGDPLIKSQRRSRQLSMSRNRMIADVATADVVLVNPTTYAVALKYEAGKSAPRVVAKGKGVIAEKIRSEADKHKVTMVRDIPLTRAIHASVKLGDVIPKDFYHAVAVVLTFVAALKRRGKEGGVHEVPQN